MVVPTPSAVWRGGSSAVSGRRLPMSPKLAQPSPLKAVAVCAVLGPPGHGSPAACLVGSWSGAGGVSRAGQASPGGVPNPGLASDGQSVGPGSPVNISGALFPHLSTRVPEPSSPHMTRRKTTWEQSPKEGGQGNGIEAAIGDRA